RLDGSRIRCEGLSEDSPVSRNGGHGGRAQTPGADIRRSGYMAPRVGPKDNSSDQCRGRVAPQLFGRSGSANRCSGNSGFAIPDVSPITSRRRPIAIVTYRPTTFENSQRRESTRLVRPTMCSTNHSLTHLVSRLAYVSYKSYLCVVQNGVPLLERDRIDCSSRRGPTDGETIAPNLRMPDSMMFKQSPVPLKAQKPTHTTQRHLRLRNESLVPNDMARQATASIDVSRRCLMLPIQRGHSDSPCLLGATVCQYILAFPSQVGTPAHHLSK